MKFIHRLIFVCLALMATTAAATVRGVEDSAVCCAVAQLLESGHYSNLPVNAEISRKFLSDYLEELDKDHLYFSRADVDALAEAHESTLGREVISGQLASAFEIFDLFKRLVDERTEKIGKTLKGEKFEFDSNRTAEISRENAPWPGKDELDQLWHNRLEGELLEEKLSGTPMEECINLVRDRYEQIHSELQQKTRHDAVAIFLDALARAYDPHSEYLNKEELEDLNSDMRLSMVGIGVIIEIQGRYVRIAGLLPGSPAALDGRLKINDRIIAVARGNEEFVETEGMSIDRILVLLRSKKGTRVRLRVSAQSSSAKRNEISLTSRKIDLIEDEANGDLIGRENPGGKSECFGWITIPSFYGDPDQPAGRSVTKDVRNIILRMKQDHVAGVVIDLRNNPGGELEEAVGVAGLFLGRVPIVQEKDRSGKVYVSMAEERRLFGGPLVVLTDHSTASAAELLASALQDYGRAVVVGGHYPTYGKGSVQTVVELGDILQGVDSKESSHLGALQLTIAKFYRVNGQSTQLRGLTADIQLPSPEDLPSEGESSMRNPLKYDETFPVRPGGRSFNSILPVPQLKELSASRVAMTQEFRFLAEDLDLEMRKDKANRVSLNESLRRRQMEDDSAREKMREASRKQGPRLWNHVVHISPRELHDKRVSSTTTGMDEPESTDPESKKDPVKKAPDVIRNETLEILNDLAHIAPTKAELPDRLAKYSSVTNLDLARKAR